MEATLRSVVGQDYQPIEIIIVDDGSTDATPQMAEHFCAAHPNARLIRKANGGVGSARNAGIAAAQGTFVAPVDADDLWHSTKIRKQVEAALRAPELPGFVYCFCRTIDPAGLIRDSAEPIAAEGRALFRLLVRNFVGNGSALLMPKSVVSKIGGYDEHLLPGGLGGCEDLLLQLRIAARHPIAVAPEYLVGYCVAGTGMSRDPESMFRSYRTVLRRFVGECPAIPKPVLAVSIARRCYDLAEVRLFRRQFGAALAMLARAFVRDPLRTSIAAAYRLHWLLRRRFAPSPAPASTPFEEADPSVPIHADADAMKSGLQLLIRFDEARRRRLADLEEKLLLRPSV